MTDVMDVRIRDRYLRRGQITNSEVDKHLKDLPDLTASAEFVDYMKMFEEERAAAAAAEDEDDEDDELDEDEPVSATGPDAS